MTITQTNVTESKENNLSKIERDKLVTDNLWVAKQVARRLWRGCIIAGIEKEDAQQMVTIGMMKAATRFNPERGRGFPAVAYGYGIKVLLNEIRAAQMVKRQGQVEWPRTEDGAMADLALSREPAPDYLESEQAELVKRCLALVSRRERCAIRQRYHGRKEFDQIIMAGKSGNYGTAKARVTRAIVKIQKKVKNTVALSGRFTMRDVA